MNKKNYDINEISSLVDNTITSGCFLNKLSLDQIGRCNSNAKAKKSKSAKNSIFCLSSKFLTKFSAFLKEVEYSFAGMKLTFNANFIFIILNSSNDKSVFFIMTGVYFLISSREDSGENNSKFFFKIMLLKAESFQKKVNKTFESTTSFIYIRPFFFNSA